MTSRTALGLLLSIVAGTALLAPACFLPDFTVADAVAGDGAAPPADGPTVTPDGASGDSAVVSEGGTCAGSTAECDGNASTVCETDLKTSQAHCGACGRSCGTAQCQAGECEIERLVKDLSVPAGLELAGPRLLWQETELIRGCRAVDCNASKAAMVDVGIAPATIVGGLSPRQIAVAGQAFFFSQCPSGSSFDCAVAGCDVGGCKLTGATYVTPPTGNRKAQLLVGGNGSIYTHQGIDGLYRTDLAAKTATPGNLYKIGDQLQAFYVDPQRALWLDDNASMANPVGGLFVCPAAGCTGAAVRLLPPPVRHLAVDKDIAYTTTGGSTAATASITACDVKGCGGAGSVLATNQPYPSDIVADGNAVYWTTVGAPSPVTNTAAVGTLLRCTLPSCAGGPTKIAEGLVNPTAVRVDATHVYWLERGLAAQATGQISRRRR